MKYLCSCFLVKGDNKASLKRNSNSMICVSSSNSTSGLGQEAEISGAVGSDQVSGKLIYWY